MHYLIDGYNFIFYRSERQGTLEGAREALIETLAALERPLIIVFDGREAIPFERGHRGLLEIVYTQSADDYIVDEISRAKDPYNYTVITADRGLAASCREAGGRSLSIRDFLSGLKKNPSNKQEKPSRDSDRNIERLLRIFDEKKGEQP